MSTNENKSETVPILSKEEIRKKLREKLHSKIKQKQVGCGRMNIAQKKKEVDDYCKKMGISESDLKSLTELSEKFLKKKTK